MVERTLPLPIPPERRIYASRTLNLRSIGAIGYDMDYTLVHYHADAWEHLAYMRMRELLAADGWPVNKLEFDPDFVIRGLVMTLCHAYGVPTIFGFKNGFAGLNPEPGFPGLELDPQAVRDIHTRGGTILGSSRGHQETTVMVDTLERMNIRLLFTIGGGGTFRGALALAEEIEKRGLKIGVVAIP